MTIYETPLNELLDKLLDSLQNRNLIDPNQRDKIKDLVTQGLAKKFDELEKTPTELLSSPLGQKILLQLVVGAQLTLIQDNHPTEKFNFKAFANDVLEILKDSQNASEEKKEKSEKNLDKLLSLTLPILTTSLANPDKQQGLRLPGPKPARATAQSNKLDEFEEAQIQLFRTLYGVTPQGIPLATSYQAPDPMGIPEQPGSRQSDATVSGIVALLDKLTTDQRHALTAMKALEEFGSDRRVKELITAAAQGPVPKGPG